MTLTLSQLSAMPESIECSSRFQLVILTKFLTVLEPTRNLSRSLDDGPYRVRDEVFSSCSCASRCRCSRSKVSAKRVGGATDFRYADKWRSTGVGVRQWRSSCSTDSRT